MPEGSPSMIDDRLWLRFDDRQFAVGDLIRPIGFGPAHWQDLRQRDQFCSNRVYIVRAANPDRLPQTSWNHPERWCYQVRPKLPLERDRDTSHHDVFDSWMCQAAIVVRVLQAPHRRGRRRQTLRPRPPHDQVPS